MMTPTATSTRPVSARERLINASLTLFAHNGINTTGVDALAAEAGVTKATLYNNFGNKDGLITAYLARQRDLSLAGLARADDTSATPAARLDILFSQLADDVAHGRFQGCPFAKAAVEVPQSDAAMAIVRDHRAQLVAHVRQIVHSAVDSQDHDAESSSTQNRDAENRDAHDIADSKACENVNIDEVSEAIVLMYFGAMTTVKSTGEASHIETARRISANLLPAA